MEKIFGSTAHDHVEVSLHDRVNLVCETIWMSL